MAQMHINRHYDAVLCPVLDASRMEFSLLTGAQSARPTMQARTMMTFMVNVAAMN